MKKTVISVVLCAAVLLGVSAALNKTANRNWNREHLWLMQTLLPGSEAFVKIPYDGEDTNITAVHKSDNGFVVQTVTNGYAGEITVSVGVNLDGRVTGLVVEEAHETLGLGSRILTDHVFLSQFLNKTGSFEIAVQEADALTGATAVAETEGEAVPVDGISGATVSSKAVIRCVNSAVAYVTGADAVSAATG